MFEVMQNRVKSGYRSLAKQCSNRLLESYLTEVVTTVEAHKKKGVRFGDQRYKILWDRVDQRIDQFCKDHSVSRADIEAQVPALADLKHYAEEPEPTKVYFGKLGIVLAIPVSIFIAGVTSGTVQLLFHLGHHLVVR